MRKKKPLDSDISPVSEMPPMPEMPAIPASEYPSPLISKLCTFYNKYPDYETGIIDIAVLARLLNQELAKFVHRPHKKVTKIYFDRECSESLL